MSCYKKTDVEQITKTMLLPRMKCSMTSYMKQINYGIKIQQIFQLQLAIADWNVETLDLSYRWRDLSYELCFILTAVSLQLFN